MLKRPAPTTTDARKPGKPLQRKPLFRPGVRAKTVAPHGGGGPENTGAQQNNPRQGYRLQQQQPTWTEFYNDDYFGPAAASRTPDTSGGGNAHNGDLKANSFRQLGDLHGGRQ